MTIASTTKRIAKHPHTRRFGWLVAMGAAAAAAVGGLIWYEEKSAKAANKIAPTPGVQTPVWTQLTPVANPQLPGTYMVQVPANATFAFADDVNDPNLTAIIAGLTQATRTGDVGSVQNEISASGKPAGWPTNDPFPDGAYRITAVANRAFGLSLGALSSLSPATTPAVWIITGFAG